MALITTVGPYARLALYSVTGRRVAVLADGAFPAGSHAVRWSGEDARGGRLAPGVYFARLELDGAPAATQRVVRMP